MSRKHVIHQYNMFEGQTINMSGNLTSNISNVEQLDKCSIHLTWTAGPVGEFIIEARNGGNPAPNTALPKSKYNDSWYVLPTSSLGTITGTDSELLILLNELPFTDVRIRYVASSGAAADLKALLTAKVVGA